MTSDYLASAGADKELPVNSDVDYFNSYDDIGVHELMLKDAARMQAFRDFIERNGQQFVNKIVVDVGSGTGILSLFAARAGAKHVFAIEAAKGIAKLSQQIIKQNGFEDRITVINSAVEDVQLPNGVLADVIISEWMGFYLFHESMLGAVITARDKLLKPDGVVFPSSGTLHICPVALKEYFKERIDFWRDVYGFDFSAVASIARAAGLARPEILTVSQQSLLAKSQQVISIDMKYVDLEDVNSILATVSFNIERNDVMHGFALWFDVLFEGNQSVVLDTSPASISTHWKQTVALLPDALLVNRGSQLSSRVQLKRQERRYDISIEILVDDDSSEEDECDMVEVDADDAATSNASAELHDLIALKMKPVI